MPVSVFTVNKELSSKNKHVHVHVGVCTTVRLWDTSELSTDKLSRTAAPCSASDVNLNYAPAQPPMLREASTSLSRIGKPRRRQVSDTVHPLVREHR